MATFMALAKCGNPQFVTADIHAAPSPCTAFAGIEEEEHTIGILALANAA